VNLAVKRYPVPVGWHRQTMTTLPEAFVLLTAGLEPDRWRGRREAQTRRALATAVFAELVLRKRLMVEGEEVDVAPTPPTGDALLDGALASIEAAEGKDGQDLVAMLGDHLRGAEQWMLTAFAAEGVVGRERRPYRGVFTQTVWVARDSPLRRALLARLRAAAAWGYEAAPFDAALLVLTHEAGLLDGVVGAGERAHLRDGAVALALVHPFGRFVRAAMEAEAPAVALAELVRGTKAPA